MDPESDRVAPVRMGDQLRFTSMAVTFGQRALEGRQAELKGVFGWVTTQAGSNLFLPRRCYRHAIEKVAEVSEDAIDKRLQGEDADITNQLGFEPEEDGDECEPGSARKKERRPKRSSLNAIAPKKVAKKRGPAGGTKYTSRAEEQIEYLRGANAPDYLIPRTAFIRLAKETLDELAAANLAFADGGGVRMGSDALACVQWACEGMLSELFADVAAAAAHGKRIGIMPWWS